MKRTRHARGRSVVNDPDQIAALIHLSDTGPPDAVQRRILLMETGAGESFSNACAVLRKDVGRRCLDPSSRNARDNGHELPQEDRAGLGLAYVTGAGGAEQQRVGLPWPHAMSLLREPQAQVVASRLKMRE